MSRCRGISRRKGGTCASGGAHRTTARCGLSTCVSMEHFSRAPAVIAAPAPVVEHIAPSAAVSYTVPLAVYAVLSACGGVHCACSCGGCSTALCWRAARGPLTNTGKLQDTVSQFWGFSHCQDTLVKTRFCGSILSAPLLTDPCRLTVGPGTREDHDAVQVRDLWRTRRVDVPGFGRTLAALDMSSILTLCEQNLGLVDTFLAQALVTRTRHHLDQLEVPQLALARVQR